MARRMFSHLDGWRLHSLLDDLEPGMLLRFEGFEGLYRVVRQGNEHDGVGWWEFVPQDSTPAPLWQQPDWIPQGWIKGR